MEENVIQIDGGITINVDVGVKKHAVVKMEIFSKYYRWFSNYCDKVIETYDEETKTIPPNFNEKKQPVKHKVYIFYLHFY